MSKNSQSYKTEIKIRITCGAPSQQQDYELVLGQIKISPKEPFDQILSKINRILLKNQLPVVDSFQYEQEDGDYSYVNQDLIDRHLTDFYQVIKLSTTIYIEYQVPQKITIHGKRREHSSLSPPLCHKTGSHRGVPCQRATRCQ